MNKKSLPRLDLYPDDLLSLIYKTREDADVTGARLRLWCVACSGGRPDPIGTLPTDDTLLAQWAGLSPERWAEVSHLITKGWRRVARAKRWRIRRIVEQAEVRDRYIEAGRNGATRRWKHSPPNRGGNGQATDWPLGYSYWHPTPTPSPTDNKTSKPTEPPPSAPTEAPKATPGSWKARTEDDTKRLDAIWKRIERKYGDGAYTKLRSAFYAWTNSNPPLEVAFKALLSVADHEARDPVAYLLSVLRIEEPNAYEARAIHEHNARKQERPIRIGDITKQLADKRSPL